MDSIGAFFSFSPITGINGSSVCWNETVELITNGNLCSFHSQVIFNPCRTLKILTRENLWLRWDHLIALCTHQWLRALEKHLLSFSLCVIYPHDVYSAISTCHTRGGPLNIQIYHKWCAIIHARGAHSSAAGCLPPWHTLSLSAYSHAAPDELCERGFRAAGSVRVFLSASSLARTRQLLPLPHQRCVRIHNGAHLFSLCGNTERIREREREMRAAAVLLTPRAELGNSLRRRARLLALWASARERDVLLHRPRD